jgi:hypothetical protein
MIHSGYFIAIALASALAALPGCSSSTATPSDDPRAHGVMKVLGLEYAAYLAAHRGGVPKDEAEFRKFIESRPAMLEEYRVQDVNVLFKSPRDGGPIGIVTGVSAPVLDSSGYALAAYERTGVDGKRLVVNARGGVSPMTSEEFAAAFPGVR